MTPAARSRYLVTLNAANEMPFFCGPVCIHLSGRASGTFKRQARFTEYRQRAAVLEGMIVIFFVEADCADLPNR
jgi:hypothetical protein